MAEPLIELTCSNVYADYLEAVVASICIGVVWFFIFISIILLPFALFGFLIKWIDPNRKYSISLIKIHRRKEVSE